MKSIKPIMISLFFTLFISLNSCNSWQGQPGVSDNIADSQKRGVYICEYIANPNPIKINDSLEFQIEMAWLERQWQHVKKYEGSNPLNGYQLIILTKNKIPGGFDKTWTIGVDFDRYIRTCGKTCLISDFEKLPIASKEVWPVQKGWELTVEAKKEILGEFVLFRK